MINGRAALSANRVLQQALTGPLALTAGSEYAEAPEPPMPATSADHRPTATEVRDLHAAERTEGDHA